MNRFAWQRYQQAELSARRDNKHRKHSERAAHVLANFVAVIARLMLSNLIKMAMMRSSLYQWQSSPFRLHREKVSSLFYAE